MIHRQNSESTLYHMELENHYVELWKHSSRKFNAGQYELDPLISSDQDNRYGITLLARPSNEIKQRVSQILQRVKAVAPHQYYYPASDLHITVLSIISCYPGFSLEQIDIEEYKNIIESAVRTISPFYIHFKGLTASPSCILVQGFPEDNQLNELRNELRTRFKHTNLQHSIDSRYTLKAAHLTVIRFKQQPAEPKLFIREIENLRETDFGRCLINELEFVGNDWYQRKDKVKQIQTFKIV